MAINITVIKLLIVAVIIRVLLIKSGILGSKKSVKKVNPKTFENGGYANGSKVILDELLRMPKSKKKLFKKTKETSCNLPNIL